MASSISGQKGSSVEDTIEIGVPAAFIWEILQDVNGWAGWNPIYLTAQGSAGLGDTIDLTVALPRMKPQKTSAKVLRAEPESQLHYGSPSLGGLLRATRYIEITPLGPESCAVTNGELMQGLLGKLAHKGLGPRILEALEHMNKGFKAEAETRWRSKASAQRVGED